MSGLDLHPMARLTDSEGKRLDAIIKAVGSRLDKELRRNGEEPDESDIFESALAAVVAYVDARTVDDITGAVAKAKPGPARRPSVEVRTAPVPKAKCPRIPVGTKRARHE